MTEFHPMNQVADLLADDLRRSRASKPAVEPIAWITQHGELFCSACVQPTMHQREDWLGVKPGDPGEVEPCDLCGVSVVT